LLLDDLELLELELLEEDEEDLLEELELFEDEEEL
jgi:hypothetical protein